MSWISRWKARRRATPAPPPPDPLPRPHRNEGPAWNAPTTAIDNRPLLTRGQQARADHASRPRH